MTVFRYKAVIPGNKIFMREYELETRMSLFKLHEFLDRDLGFSPDQMTVFETLSDKGELMRRIGLFDFGDGSMDRVSVEDTQKEGAAALRYVYNIGKGLFIELRFESEADYNPRLSYPVLVAEKGRNPDQFSSAYEDYEEFSNSGSAQADVQEEAFDEEELPEGEEAV